MASLESKSSAATQPGTPKSPVADQLSVFVAGIHLASGIIQGCARGSLLNLACLSPKGAVQWGRRIMADPDLALQQEAQIRKVFGTAMAPLSGKFSNTALDKALAAAGGWAGLSPTLRWPLSSISSLDVQQLSTQFREGLPFLFEDALPNP